MGVTVDNDFVRFGSKSYAINKITSVEVRERKPYGSGIVVFLIILAVLFAGNSVSGDKPLGAIIMQLGIAAVLAFAARAQHRKSLIVEYQLFLITSAAETQAFVTRDVSEVVDLRERIERAMIQQARNFAGA